MKTFYKAYVLFLLSLSQHIAPAQAGHFFRQEGDKNDNVIIHSTRTRETQEVDIGTCSDDPTFEFTRDDGEAASCQWLRESEEELSFRVETYCFRTHIRYACPKSCLEDEGQLCECPPDVDGLPILLNIGFLRPCTWLTQNFAATVDRQERYCFDSENTEAASAGVGEDCVASCGFCKGTFPPLTSSPSLQPTVPPSKAPSSSPSSPPTKEPTVSPSKAPSSSPSNPPTKEPTVSPSQAPSSSPSSFPSECVDEPEWKTHQVGFTCAEIKELVLSGPEFDYCVKFSNAASQGKSIYEACCVCGGSAFTTVFPSTMPSMSKQPSASPTGEPSSSPSDDPSSAPSGIPSDDPTEIPSSSPSDTPTMSPSDDPSSAPSGIPSDDPTEIPSSSPSDTPTMSPSDDPSSAPSGIPSDDPTEIPSSSPSDTPTMSPSDDPSSAPSGIPSDDPTEIPSSSPSDTPTMSPSDDPSSAPSGIPSNDPTEIPSSSPSDTPTRKPSYDPSSAPTLSPSNAPTRSPSKIPTNFPTESCSDDSEFTFALDDGEVQNCEWLTNDVEEAGVRIENYCYRGHVKGACQKTCSFCECVDDSEHTFELLNVEGTRSCTWLTQSSNPSVDQARIERYCYDDLEQTTASNDVGDYCVLSCGFCKGYYSSPPEIPS